MKRSSQWKERIMKRCIFRAMFLVNLLFAPLLFSSLLGGCVYEKRPSRTQDELLKTRAESDARSRADTQAIITRAMQRTKAQYDDFNAHRAPSPPVIDILIVSGGGDWGAFG